MTCDDRMRYGAANGEIWDYKKSDNLEQVLSGQNQVNLTIEWWCDSGRATPR